MSPHAPCSLLLSSIKKIDILGVPAHVVDFDETLQIVMDTVSNGSEPRYIVAQNAEKIMKARKDKELAKLMEDAILLYPDGVGIHLASKILYGKPVVRVPGYDLLLKILQCAAERKWRIFLLGAREEVIKATVRRLMQEYPGMNIVGYMSGYFDSDKTVCETIGNTNPDVLFVGMGSPKQEKWIYRNLKNLNVNLCMGVGGSFDVIAGRVELTPKWIRDLGFEFVYRLVKQPKRIKRQIVFPNFLCSLLAKRTNLRSV